MSSSVERSLAARADRLGGRWSVGALAGAVAALVSGVAVFVNGVAVRHFDDATVYTTAKNLWAGVLLAACCWRCRCVRRRDPSTGRAVVPAWPWLVVVAVIGGAVPFVLFFEGLALATSTDAAFIHKTLVVWVAIGASVVLRERLRPVHLVAIALLVVGHVVVSGGISLAVSVGARR
jgi:drug/metabolite transporter (DMT)-like permease